MLQEATHQLLCHGCVKSSVALPLHTLHGLLGLYFKYHFANASCTCSRPDLAWLHLACVQRVKTRRKEVQRRLLQLMADRQPVILIGHALHNDLKALQVDVGLVIDTGKIFRYRWALLCPAFQLAFR